MEAATKYRLLQLKHLSEFRDFLAFVRARRLSFSPDKGYSGINTFGEAPTGVASFCCQQKHVSGVPFSTSRFRKCSL